MEIKTFGPIDERAFAQLVRCAEAGDAPNAVLCADHHVGYAQPIGGAIAYRDYVSPSGVGYDIGCLAAGTLVTMADGRKLPIESVAMRGNLLGNANGLLTDVGVAPVAIAKKAQVTLVLSLTNGDELHLTPDHQLLTPHGWVEAEQLKQDDMISVASYVGVSADHDDTNEYDHKLIRLFGYVVGDGHVTTSKNRVAFYTSRDEDALTLLSDLHGLGYTNANVHRRIRANGSVENQVYCNSDQLHQLFRSWGLVPGSTRWEYASLKWLLELPDYLKVAWLGGLFSAEMAAPLVRRSILLGSAMMKQGGINPLPLLTIVREILASLKIESEIYLSGKPKRGKQTYQLMVLGGQRAAIQTWRMIGFPYARYKQAKAAEAMSIVWQREHLLHERQQANALCRELRQQGMGVHKLAVAVQERTGETYSHSMAMKAIYHQRPTRSAANIVLLPHVDGDFVWVAIESITTEAGEIDVYDIPLTHEAHNFIANGIVAHNCGNKAVLTNLQASEINTATVMNEVVRRVSFGVGRANNEPVDHPVLDAIASAAFEPQRKLANLAAQQLGTVGSGNHYVDLFEDEEGRLWVGVHFGSRGFGHRTASGFLAMAQGAGFEDRVHEGEMDSPPTLLATATYLGEAYIEAMSLAGQYAYAGRDLVVDKVLEILDVEALFEVHNHHNFAWREKHFGEELWVVRKGCTPAFPGQQGFVGATMGDISVVLEGMDSPDAQQALFSTVHGAGRVMSRTQAAGKRKWVKGANGARVQTTVRPGLVDWDKVRRQIKAKGIELRGSGPDEAPEVYKRLDEVLNYHAGTVTIRHRLRPIGVAMAGADVYDPYKD